MKKLVITLVSLLILHNSVYATSASTIHGDEFKPIYQDLALSSTAYFNSEQMTRKAWDAISRIQSSKSCRVDLEKIEHIYGERKDDVITPRIQQEEAYSVIANDKTSHLEFYDFNSSPFFYKKTKHFNFRISSLGGGQRVIESTHLFNGQTLPSLDYIIWQDNLFSSHITDEETNEQAQEIKKNCETCRFLGIFSTPLEEFVSNDLIPSVKRFFNGVTNTFSKSHMERSMLKVSIDLVTGAVLKISTVKIKGRTNYSHVPGELKKVETNCIVSLDDYKKSIELLILQNHLQRKNKEKTILSATRALEVGIAPEAIISTLTSNVYGLELMKDVLPQNKQLLTGFFNRYKLFPKEFTQKMISLAEKVDLSNIPGLNEFFAEDFNKYSPFLLDIMQRQAWPKEYALEFFKQLDNHEKMLWFTDLVGKDHLSAKEARELFKFYGSPLYTDKKQFSDALMLMSDKGHILYKEMIDATYKYHGQNWPKDFNDFIPEAEAKLKIETELLKRKTSIGLAEVYYNMAYKKGPFDKETVSNLYQVAKMTPIQEYKLLKDHPELAKDMMIKALKDPETNRAPIHATNIFDNMTVEERKEFLEGELHQLIEDTPLRLSAYNTLITKLDTLFKDNPSALNHLRSLFAERIVSGDIHVDEKSSPIFSYEFLTGEYIHEFTDTPHFKKAFELGDINFLPQDDPTLISRKIRKAYPKREVSEEEYKKIKSYQEFLLYQDNKISSSAEKKDQARFDQYFRAVQVDLINRELPKNANNIEELFTQMNKLIDQYEGLEELSADELIPLHNTVAKFLWESSNWKNFIEDYLLKHEFLREKFVQNILNEKISSLHSTEGYDFLTILIKDFPYYKNNQYIPLYFEHYLKDGVPINREGQFVELIKENEQRLKKTLDHIKLEDVDPSIGQYIFDMNQALERGQIDE